MQSKFKKKLKCFTLVEVLMVVAIMGILAATILVATNSARKKAKDARIQSDMGALRLKMERYFSKNQSYSTFCTDILHSSHFNDAGVDTVDAYSPKDLEVINVQKDIEKQGATNGACHDGATVYAYSVKLNNDKNLCIDQTNTVKEGMVSKASPARCEAP